MYKNGKAAPSLHPDSAASRCRKCAGTCLSAYFPPMTAAARIGSVGVRHAATARLLTKLRPGMRAKIKPAETNQPCRTRLERRGKQDGEWTRTQVMTGAKSMNRLFQCLAMYALGNSTPIAKTPMAKTTRDISRVILFKVSSLPPPHPRGSNMSAP